VAWMEKHKDGRSSKLLAVLSSCPFDAKQSLVENIVHGEHQRCSELPTYAAMVESMDDAVGKLLDTIDRLGSPTVR